MSADAEKYKLLASLKILRHHLEIWRIDPEDDRNPLETNEPRIEREELKQTLWVEWIGISFAESWPSKAHPQRKPLKESRSPRAPQESCSTNSHRTQALSSHRLQLSPALVLVSCRHIRFSVRILAKHT